MSPKRLGISTTYKTRVALEKPCKQRQGIVIGQLTGQSLQQQRNKKVGYPLYPFWLRLLQEEGKLSSRRRSLRGFAQRESLQAIRFCLSHFLGTIAIQTLTGRRLVPNKSFASVRSVRRRPSRTDGADDDCQSCESE
jgi:hypothetical protein